MGQDRETGAAGNAYGRRMAGVIAKLLLVERLSRRSNEVRWRGGFAVIKCCGPRTTSLGVTADMLMRINTVLVACEDECGNVEIFELAAVRFRQNMVDSQSSSAAGGRVAKVARSVVRRYGTKLRTCSAMDVAAHAYLGENA
jgi:hypothetical protein